MKIGLIGNNISSSNAPDIHIRLAKIFQIPLEYLLFDLKDKEENYFVDTTILVNTIDQERLFIESVESD